MLTTKIKTPSFSLGDVTRSHLVGGAAGLVLASVGAAGLIYGANEQRTVASMTTTSLAMQSALSPLITQNGSVTSDRFLADAIRNIRMVERRIGVGSPEQVFNSDLRQYGTAMLSSWRDLTIRAGALDRSVASSDVLRAKLAELVPDMSRAEKRLDLIKNNSASTQALISFGDSLARLQSYADSGAVMLRTSRIDYDVKNLAYQGAIIAEHNSQVEAKSLRQDADLIYQRASPAVRQAVEAAAARTDMAAFIESARTAMSRAVSVERLTGLSFRTGSTVVTVATIAVLLGVILLAGSVFLAMREFDSRFTRSLNQFRGGQKASRQILEDINLIADGDLGIQVRSDDEATRDLAEGINKITLRFRSFIGRIGSLASSIEERARLHAANTEGDVGSSRQQERDIRKTNGFLTDTIASISDMSVDTKATTFAAKTAMSAVHDGARAVQDSIERMDGIRDGMQETSKRIKRVAERSQELSKIVDILGLLSGQANVLAMNASLEANRAGEQGRGFQVVAKEVQHLHKRIDEALLSISSVVEAMQSDTREAIDATERSTQNVVDGAFVAEIAGASLSVIKGVTEALATMISSIEGSCNTHRDFATDAATGLDSALSLSLHSTDAIERAASVIHDISRISKDIKSSTAELRA